MRVTLVTAINDQILNPYQINTDNENVLFDRENNSIYFPLESKTKGIFSFRISITSSHTFHQSQLIFTLAYRHEKVQFPSLLLHTSVTSQIFPQQNIDSINSKENLRCIPRQSQWQGGEEMIIHFPNEVQRKSEYHFDFQFFLYIFGVEYKIYFDFGLNGLTIIDNIQLLDRKTILFQIPPCLYQLSDIESVKVWIRVQENDVVLFPSIEFSYFARMSFELIM